MLLDCTIASTNGCKKDMHQSVGYGDANKTQLDAKKEKMKEPMHAQPMSKGFC